MANLYSKLHEQIRKCDLLYIKSILSETVPSYYLHLPNTIQAAFFLDPLNIID